MYSQVNQRQRQDATPHLHPSHGYRSQATYMKLPEASAKHDKCKEFFKSFIMGTFMRSP
jgi:hypothetical protein